MSTSDHGAERPVTSDDPHLLDNLRHVDAMHERYELAISQALSTRTHLWGAFTMYRLADDEVRLMVQAGEAGVLSQAAVPQRGPDRLLSVQVGCLVCEQPPNPVNVRMFCPGEPDEPARLQ